MVIFGHDQTSPAVNIFNFICKAAAAMRPLATILQYQRVLYLLQLAETATVRSSPVCRSRSDGDALPTSNRFLARSSQSRP